MKEKELKEGTTFEWSSEDHIMDVGAHFAFGNWFFWIRFNGRMIETYRTFVSFKKKVDSLIAKHNLKSL